MPSQEKNTCTKILGIIYVCFSRVFFEFQESELTDCFKEKKYGVLMKNKINQQPTISNSSQPTPSALPRNSARFSVMLVNLGTRIFEPQIFLKY